MGDAMQKRMPVTGHRSLVTLFIGALVATVAAPGVAQDLGPHVRKVRDGIWVYAAKPQDANVTIIETREGLVLVDTGQTPADSRAVQAIRSEEHTSELQSLRHLVCRLLLEK